MIIAIAIVVLIAVWISIHLISQLDREIGYLRGINDASDTAKRAGHLRLAISILRLPKSNAHKSPEQRDQERTQDGQQ